ncbi:MAG TPA: hypothetical protein VMT99_03575 [Candidatus Paceibacterota bacterium]|nr:hypothetical protein [Candidatus Paceibacterota bacterium]
MAHPFDIRDRAVQLRRDGYSLNEILSEIHIAKSTLSRWVRDVELDAKARKRLLERIQIGQLAARDQKKNKVLASIRSYDRDAMVDLERIRLKPEYARLLCCMLYWCEGAKDRNNGVRFTNSDPALVSLFLALFRNSFSLDERKFRVCMHLHAYHEPMQQLDFWSEITNISKRQFLKPYRKANTGKRTREGYQGCVTVYYHDNAVARRLLSFAMTALSVLNKRWELS